MSDSYISLLSILMIKQTPNKPSIEKYGDKSVEIVNLLSVDPQANSIRYDPSCHFIAIGCSTGERPLYTVDQRKITSTIHAESEAPITCLRWRPHVHSKNKVLLSSDSLGILNEYLLPAHVKRWSMHQLHNNTIQCFDYSPDGRQFITAGNDRHVKLYDEQVKKLIKDIDPAQQHHLGHSNRIFCVRYPTENVAITGGWDNVVHIWDLRIGESVRHILGPQIASDSIDMQGGQLLVGCQDSKSPLRLYDFGTAKLLQNLDWSGFKDETPRVFCARFSPESHDSQTIAAGASGMNQLKIFKSDGTSYKPVNKVYSLKGGVYSLDFSPTKKQLAFCDNSGLVGILSYDK